MQVSDTLPRPHLRSRAKQSDVACAIGASKLYDFEGMALPDQFCWPKKLPFGADWNSISNDG